MRDHAYRASIELAVEKGAFPLFDQRYVDSQFVQRLPDAIRDDISRSAEFATATCCRLRQRERSVSRSPTTRATASNRRTRGPIERRKRDRDGEFESFTVEDHAYRQFRECTEQPRCRMRSSRRSRSPRSTTRSMVAAVQPFIDSAISKTVNIPADYPFDRVSRSVSNRVGPGRQIARDISSEHDYRLDPVHERRCHARLRIEADRRIEADGAVGGRAQQSCAGRDGRSFADGNPAHCYMVKHPHGQKFALFVGHFEEAGAAHPFEVWVNGIEQPRGLERARDQSQLRHVRARSRLAAPQARRLERMRRRRRRHSSLPMPPNGRATARSQSGRRNGHIWFGTAANNSAHLRNIDATPVLDALMTRVEPRTGVDGTLSWTVDVANPATGDEFILGLKELQMQQGGALQRRPYAIWLSGVYPESARRSVQSAVARHARDRSGVDREEAARIADVCRTEG